MKAHKLLPLAKLLRTNSTDAERLLWRHFRGKRFAGIKFRRQQPMGRYIVDFVCLEKRLVIELDGGQHAEHAIEDAERDACLGREGYRVLRFWNNDVLINLEGVLTRVREVLVASCPELSPSPQPSPIKGEGALEGGDGHA